MNSSIMWLLCLVVVMERAHSMPQGFFSQGFSVPKLVSWNGNDRTLAILPGVKVTSPIKSSHINIFGKKTTEDKKTKKEQHPVNQLEQLNEGNVPAQNYPLISKQNETPKESNDIIHQDVQLPNDLHNGGQLISKFSDFNDNIDTDYASNKEVEKEVTTEVVVETTTDVETTTFSDEDLFNRASPQLVASLIG